MIGLSDMRDLRFQLRARVAQLRSISPMAVVAAKLDETMRAISGGLSPHEIRAILRGENPTEKPNPRYRLHTKSFWFHLRPRYYQAGSTWFTHTFRLGWLTTFFFVVEVFTGLILMIFYAPSPERAYGDMLTILSNVPFGRFMRDLHRLGAELMVIAVTLHMFRVYLTGSFKGPRSFTWLTGVVLLLVTLFLSFSGYLLPWDQLAYWAVTIGTSMAEAAPLFGNEVNLLLRGAPDIGAGGLLRFYLLHIFLLPMLAVIFISVHYYKVSREHGISLPAVVEEGNDPEIKKHGLERIDFIPDLLTHELLLVAGGLFFMVLAVSFFFHAPLEHHSNPLRTPLHTTAPWYFLWLQGMLKLGDKSLMGVVLPTLIFALFFAVPYIDEYWDRIWGRPSRRLARYRKLGIFLGLVTAASFAILTIMGQPTWGIETPAAQEIGQEFIPEEGVGPVRELPYDQLQPGVYNTMQFTLPARPNQFERTFAEFKARVETEKKLPGAQGFWVIEDWQDGLKKLTLRIVWEEPGRKKEDTTFDKVVYLHRDSGYSGGE